jgi:hypothetical protein
MLKPRILIAIAVLCVVGCGGSSGGAKSGSGPSQTFTATIGPSGGIVGDSSSGPKLVVPSGAVNANASFRMEVFNDGSIGNAEASHPATPMVDIYVGRDNLAVDAKLELELPATMPAGATPYGVFLTQDQFVMPVPATLDASRTRLRFQIGKESFTASSAARNGEGRSRGMGRYASDILQPEPTARVDLYKFERSAGTSAGLNSGWTRADSPSWGGKRIALLVHGIRNDLTNLNELAIYLRGLTTPKGTLAYDEIYGCDNEWRAKIASNGRLLADLIDRYAGTDTTIDIYAHSQGGLVARWALERGVSETSGARVSRLFTFGTPNEGVPLPVIWLLAENRIFNYWPGVGDLESSSSLIEDLNGSQAVAKATYVAISGTHYSDYEGKLGTLVYVLEGEPCDGIVGLSSARSLKAGTHASAYHPLPPFSLNHSNLRGRFEDPIRLNLDTLGEQKLRDYILNTGSIGVGIE